MNFDKTNKYDKTFLKENMMGPNSVRILEELLENVPLKSGMRGGRSGDSHSCGRAGYAFCGRPF